MAYNTEYKERTTEYGRRNSGDVVMPLKEVELACLRLDIKNEKIKKLAKALSAEDKDIFPSEIYVKGKKGEVAVNLSAAFRGSLEERVSAVPFGRELFLELQKDATLRGQETIYTRDFR